MKKEKCCKCKQMFPSENGGLLQKKFYCDSDWDEAKRNSKSKLKNVKRAGYCLNCGIKLGFVETKYCLKCQKQKNKKREFVKT